jgi:hypothetical protein
MTQEQREKQINELFERAVQLPPEKRSDFLVQACGGEEALKAELESLVRHHDEAPGDSLQPSVRLALRDSEQMRREVESTSPRRSILTSYPQTL